MTAVCLFYLKKLLICNLIVLTGNYIASRGKPTLLWINVEFTFPAKQWDKFLNEKDNEVKKIERKVRNYTMHVGVVKSPLPVKV